ncbi:MAG TPA: hypothetical protein PKN47_22700, partial [Nitrospira sp.]|nr:hypothetical protein [Nitrospira sp.]
ERRVPIVIHYDSGVSEILQETPWAEIITDCRELAPALLRFRTRIKDGKLSEESLPLIPTDEQWAEQICRDCGWLD